MSDDVERLADGWLDGARARLGRAALGAKVESIGRVEEVEDGVALVSGLPDEKRGDAAVGGTLQIVSAAPLSPDEQAAAQRRVAEALGRAVDLAFAVDPELVGGLELRGAHLVVANNWRADLDRLKSEIADVG